VDNSRGSWQKNLKYYVGCRGWRDERWSGAFYPPTLDPKDYLAYYSKVFDLVELDLSGRGGGGSSYNNNNKLYDRLLFKKWATSTPHNFRFTVKLPRHIIEDTYKVGDFLEELAPLEEKVLAVIIESPPPAKLTLGNGGREWLDDILGTCTYHGYSVALEFNHSSWFQDLTYNLLNKHKAAAVWSAYSSRYSYPVVTADFLYLRMPNDNEEKWIEKAKEKVSEWDTASISSSGVRNREGEEGIGFAVVVVSNPAKVNQTLKLLGLPEKTYGHSQWIGKVIMHVDLNSFFPSCEELRDPTLKGKPHAVIMTDETKDKITRGAVASCSYEARKYGVRSAMSLFAAKQLCPQLILNPVDKPYYQHVSEKVMNLIEGYADVLEQASIDEAYLDCTKKIADGANNVEQYAATIKDAIRQQCGGLLSSIGIAATKSAAKVASDFKKPDGLTVISPDQLQKFLENLEVDRIAGIGAKAHQVLKDEMGIQTIGQLAKYDVQKLKDRFGKKNGLWMWQVANGRDSDDPVMPREDNISISTEQTLDRAISDRAKILQHLNELVDEVYERIRKQGYEFRTVGVKLVRSDFSSIETREMSFSNSRGDRESIASVLQGLVDRFSLFNNNDNSTAATITYRKVGIKISNLHRVERKKKSAEQRTLLDYT
jgi:DNA polymerase IV (archaeal DinB-like DNA polymerase)